MERKSQGQNKPKPSNTTSKIVLAHAMKQASEAKVDVAKAEADRLNKMKESQTARMKAEQAEANRIEKQIELEKLKLLTLQQPKVPKQNPSIGNQHQTSKPLGRGRGNIHAANQSAKPRGYGRPNNQNMGVTINVNVVGQVNKPANKKSNPGSSENANKPNNSQQGKSQQNAKKPPQQQPAKGKDFFDW